MSRISRSCLVCGARTSGASRCPRHRSGTGRGRACITCGTPVEAGQGNYCDEHTIERQRSGPSNPAYATPEYRRARRVALRRAGYRCEGCGRHRGDWCPTHERPIVLDADHVRAIVDGGTNDPDNLRILCSCCCHADKTRRDRTRRR